MLLLPLNQILWPIYRLSISREFFELQFCSIAKGWHTQRADLNNTDPIR